MFSTKLNFKSDALTCPYCGAYVKQKWYDVAKGKMSERGLDYYDGFIPELQLSICSKCGKYALWFSGSVIYPPGSAAPMPTVGMPISIKADFLEARNIAPISPKSACALLRICLQKLLVYLNHHGMNIDFGSTHLMRGGHPQRLEDALQIVRAIGREATPPGKISARDDFETAAVLFDLINLIVESSILRQREINKFCQMFPKNMSVRKKQPRKKVNTKRREIIPTPTLLYR